MQPPRTLATRSSRLLQRTLTPRTTYPRLPFLARSCSDKAQDPFERLISRNKAWAASVERKDPDLFPSLATQQSPEILWIGCSDSRLPETTVLGLKPGDVFVHRNIANVLLPSDLSSLSCIEFAVEYLKVKHIIVCGHTGCGGIKAALSNRKLGTIDSWLHPIRQLRLRHLAELEKLGDEEGAVRLTELNVQQSLETLKQNPHVIEAVKGRGLTVHGCIYDVGTGHLTSLDLDDTEEEARRRRVAFDLD